MNDQLERIAAVVEPFLENFEPADSQTINALEAELAVKLPVTLRSQLQRFGRCAFSGESFVMGNFGILGIFTLFGAGGSTSSIIEDRRRHPDYAINRWVPIADDMFNNRYVWDAATGKVLFIDYSIESPVVCEVAQSYDEFLQRIEVHPD